MTTLDVAAYRYLNTHPVVTRLVTEGLLGSDRQYPAWVFRSADGDPSRPVGESGKCAIVVAHTGTWALKNAHNTATFPTLRIIIYADNTRDDDGVTLYTDAADKCLEIYYRIDPLFHDPAKNIKYWGDFRVHDCIAGSPFQIQEMPQYDGSVYGLALYNVTTD